MSNFEIATVIISSIGVLAIFLLPFSKIIKNNIFRKKLKLFSFIDTLDKRRKINFNNPNIRDKETFNEEINKIKIINANKYHEKNKIIISVNSPYFWQTTGQIEFFTSPFPNNNFIELYEYTKFNRGISNFDYVNKKIKINLEEVDNVFIKNKFKTIFFQNLETKKNIKYLELKSFKIKLFLKNGKKFFIKSIKHNENIVLKSELLYFLYILKSKNINYEIKKFKLNIDEELKIFDLFKNDYDLYIKILLDKTIF